MWFADYKRHRISKFGESRFVNGSKTPCGVVFCCHDTVAERCHMAQKNLHAAKQQKLDEFYTQINDIERECNQYRDQFRGKVVFLNCDDPAESHFFIYFAKNFTRLGLKKLIATHFERTKPSYKIELTGDMNDDGQIDESDRVETPLIQNGDFRSPECVEILKEADIIVTNPPFSLFRDYIAQLMEYDKKFLVIGPKNAITYKEIFTLIKQNKLWLGYGFKGGNAYFKTPYAKEFASGVYDEKTGLVKFRNVAWFTNLDTTKRHEEILLYATYDPEKYPKYDNYDAIEVSKIAHIPKDYYGAMGVPITFLENYNPDQFEIIKFRKGDDEKDLTINGKSPYFRILIRRRHHS